MTLTSLRARDGKLVNNWYIACLSSEIEHNKPVGRTVYDTPLVLYRNAFGEVQCFRDKCLHRNAPLSEGVLIEGNIACPYHGWTYNAKGDCIHIPSEGRKFCKVQGRSLEKFPVIEQDGCVWVWTGSAVDLKAGPPYRFPHWEDPEWRRYFMVTDFENEVTQLVENFMDLPHTVFVHRGWFRTSARKRVPIKVQLTENQVLVTYLQENDNIGFNSSILNPKRLPMQHTDLFVLPNITRIDYIFAHPSNKDQIQSGFVISSQCTPVTQMKCRVYTEIAYKLPYSQVLHKILEPFLKYYTRQVISQDVEMMALQARNLQGGQMVSFQNSEADLLHVHIERLRQNAAQSEVHSFGSIKEEQAEIWI